jgi:branched-chain amino acid transport system ATP-binding protein
MSLLKLNNISRQFGKLAALTDISMEVQPGELRAVIGPNGAGKTTLFNLVSGLFPPSTGEILFEGTNISRQTPEHRVRQGIVRTFQITEVFLESTVYENIRTGVETALGFNTLPWLSHARKDQVRRRVDELIESTDLGGKEERMVGELAHGDQRVVEVAIALSLNPRLLLLDEPTAGMGDKETEHMVKLVRHLHQKLGVSMLFIEHDMELIFGIADNITVLDNGSLLAEGTPEQIATNEKVQAAYLGAAA